jgi:hypothetical protein
MGQLDADAEAERLLAAYGEAHCLEHVMPVLERQFGVLHNRAQVLLTLCGIVISTTGFSGRIIAGTNVWGQVLVIAGVALVLLSAVVVVWGVLHLRWITQQEGETPRAWLRSTIDYRDKKTNAYRVGIALMLAGLALYVGAIAVMLLNPGAPTPPAR